MGVSGVNMSGFFFSCHLRVFFLYFLHDLLDLVDLIELSLYPLLKWLSVKFKLGIEDFVARYKHFLQSVDSFHELLSLVHEQLVFLLDRAALLNEFQFEGVEVSDCNELEDLLCICLGLEHVFDSVN